MSVVPNVSTKYSLLTHVSEEDMSILREIFENVETKRFLPELYELLDTPAGIQEFVSTFEQYAQNGEGYLWGIYCDDTLTGFVAVMDLSYNPSLFYAMHPAYRSHGYMKGAISAVLDYIGKRSLCHNISTDVYKANSTSLYILQQLGFSVYKEDCDKVYLSKVLA